MLDSSSKQIICLQASLQQFHLLESAIYGLFIIPWMRCLQALHWNLREKLLQEIIFLTLPANIQFNKALQAGSQVIQQEPGSCHAASAIQAERSPNTARRLRNTFLFCLVLALLSVFSPDWTLPYNTLSNMNIIYHLYGSCSHVHVVRRDKYINVNEHFRLL